MSFLEKLGIKKNNNINIETKPLTVYQPVEGVVSTIQALNDGVFSEGILGDGCSIKPIGQVIYAPFDGKISMIANTKHAIGLTSNDGVECLIHVGIDTVNMQGDGFKLFVKNRQTIKAGEVLMQFSIGKIEENNHLTDVVIVITNSSDFKKINIVNKHTQTPLKPLIQVEL